MLSSTKYRLNSLNTVRLESFKPLEKTLQLQIVSKAEFIQSLLKMDDPGDIGSSSVTVNCD